MASLIDFTKLDFEDIKTSIKDYIRSNSNFTDYDFEGSNLSIIVDILAYNSYLTSYNANMISNEVFINSATLRENVVSLARNIGYVPRSRKSAKASISFFVDTSTVTGNVRAVTLKKGIVATTSVFGNQNFIFSIPEDITVPVVNEIALFENIKIYEGNYIETVFDVNSNIFQQRFIIPNSNIDTDTLRVFVKDNPSSNLLSKFNIALDLFDIDSKSKIFFIQEVEDQKYELIFGDGIFGEKLENNNQILASYIISNGEIANGISSFSFSGRLLDNNGGVITSGISLLTANQSSQGGSEIESINSVKNYAPRIYASQNRAVTTADYEAIVKQIYPETDSVVAFGGEELEPPEFGKVFVAIKPLFGNFLSNSIKDNLKTELRKYSLAGIVNEIVDLKYLYVEINTLPYYNPSLSVGPDNIKSKIIQNLQKYADSDELNRYGSRFKFSKIQKIIDDSDQAITSNLTDVQMRRDLSIIPNRISEYEICFGNEFSTENRNGFNIKTSGFYINNSIDLLYFTDIPNDNMVDGRIVIFRLDSETEPRIVNDNAGKIFYTKGEIILNPIIFTSTQKTLGGQPIIEISTSPKCNDVLGIKDIYLQLDISNSNIDMIPDLTSSGMDFSIKPNCRDTRLVR